MSSGKRANLKAVRDAQKAEVVAVQAMHVAEEGNILALEVLKKELSSRFGVELGVFANRGKGILPDYALCKAGKLIAFVDVLFTKMDDWIKVSAERFKIGCYTTEIFGTLKDESLQTCGEMKYVIFVVDKAVTYRWTFNRKKIKPYPTLKDDREVYVAITRDEFEPL